MTEYRLSLTFLVVALLIFIDVVRLVSPRHFEHCTVMTRIVVDKSTDHAKPHFDLLIPRSRTNKILQTAPLIHNRLR